VIHIIILILVYAADNMTVQCVLDSIVFTVDCYLSPLYCSITLLLSSSRPFY